MSLRRTASLLSCACWLALGACTPRTYQFSDGGLDAGGPDGAASDVPAPLALDLSVTGCARYDVGAARCSGAPPLALAFSPVGSPALTRFVWTFGDGAATSTERAPTHTYALPGLYDVSVVAEGPSGSISRTRAKLVEVMAVTAGGTCDVDAQCASGLACRCAGGACGVGFPRGVCSRACDATGCGVDAACVALALAPVAPPPMQVDAATDAPVGDGGAAQDAAATVDAAAAEATHDAPVDLAPAPADASADGKSDAAAAASSDGGPDGASATLTADAATPDAAGLGGPTSCLATCNADTECAAGLRCRPAPTAAGAAVRWMKACVPPGFSDVGAPCRDQDGVLDDGACATGQCLDLGALGACGATCGAAGTCPAGAACATFGNGRALCVATCGAGVTCARDPLLRCEAAGSAGGLGFQISPPPSASGATYCAPRTCAAASDCGPAGTCAPLGAGAHCTRP